MVRRVRSKRKKKLEPDLPYARDTLDLPKYFNVINTNRATERPQEPILPERRAEIGETPKAIPRPKPGAIPRGEQIPLGREETEKVPLLIRGLRYLKSLVVKVEPEPPERMPEVPELNIIDAGRTEERKQELILPERRAEIGETPKAIPKTKLETAPKKEQIPEGREETKKMPVLLRSESKQEAAPGEEQIPEGREETKKMPLLLRGLKYIKSLIMNVEPDPPQQIPKVPELNFPPLYTRYPVMKTVSKVTDVNGKITVDFPHNFVNVPGVVMTVKGADTLVGNVTDITLGDFTAVFFTIEHDHGGTVVDAGKHTPTINADGNHTHNVQGTGSLDLDTNYGRLVLADYTDYEKNHIHCADTNVYTGYESAHTHTGGTTGSENLHTHTNPNTETAANHQHTGGAIGSESVHTHTNPNTETAANHQHTGGAIGSESAHTHTNPNTGSAGKHKHSIPATDGPDDTDDAMTMLTVTYGSICTVGNCVDALSGDVGSFAQDSHWHLNTGKNTGEEAAHTHTVGGTGAGSAHSHTAGTTGWGGAHHHAQGVTGAGSAHTHTAGTTGWGGAHHHAQGVTGAGSAHSHTAGTTGVGSAHRHTMGPTGKQANPGHRHLISDPLLYNHYVYNVGLTLDLVASADENPYHYHTAPEVVDHDHVVIPDGANLWKNLSVTITYLAQEETA